MKAKWSYLVALCLMLGVALCFSMNAEAAVKKVKHSYKDIYSKKYQSQVTAQLNQWKKTKYTIDGPLLVKNPYGTMSTSIYYYGTSEKPYSVTCTLTAKGAETITHKLVNGTADACTQNHEYLITGLVAGKTNYISLQFFDEAGILQKQKKYTVKLAKDKTIP